MKKAWRIIISIVLIVLLLGGVFIGVGFLTGADTNRIYSVLDARYNLTEWIEYLTEVYSIISSEVFGGSADSLVLTTTP